MEGQVLGGLGLFLIGTVLTTDSLRAAVGNALRGVLLRFTGGPFRGLTLDTELRELGLSLREGLSLLLAWAENPR